MSDKKLITAVLLIGSLGLALLLGLVFLRFPGLCPRLEPIPGAMPLLRSLAALGLLFALLCLLICVRFYTVLRLKADSLAHTGALERENRELVSQIQSKKQFEKQMLLSASVFENTIEAIMITDAQGRILRVNQAFEDLTGYSKDDILGRNPRILQSGRHDQSFYHAIWQAVKTEGRWEGEIWNRKKDGQTFPEWLSINAIKDSDGETLYYAALFHDITDIKKGENLLRYQASYDPLTGLPNRQLLNDRLKTAIRHCERENLPMCLFFCDLDDFKNVNDSLGHYFGDLLLKEVGRRLVDCCRSDDSVARLGGDEFAIICPFIRADEPAAAALARRILDAFAKPFDIQDHKLYVQISIGITRYPEDGREIETLIKNADVAMYRSKGKGKNQFCFYTPELSVRILRRMSLSNDLRGALNRDEFMVYYQPKADIRTGRISGMEALMRWNRKGLEIVSPSEFIPLAEDTGAIYTLGEWVMEEACKKLMGFNRISGQDLSLSVNLSVKQFSQEDLVPKIRQILEKTGLDGRLLTIEITENIVISDIDRTIRILKELSAMGIGISIDDFGTGYSSLSYLKKMPLAELKIDKSFVDDLPQDPESCAIVNTVIALARNLSLKTVAEGVETRSQLDFLKETGCDEIQGYYYCRPVSASEIESFLLEEKSL